MVVGPDITVVVVADTTVLVVE
ncbi:MAG: hypothetical protein RLZZ128_767, partial [Actinomycetota bacterium]